MKTGRKEKGQELTEGFNPKKKMNKEEEAALLRLQAAQAAYEKTLPAKDGDEEPEDDDEKSAYQMLQDMRSVYKKLKGKVKLEKLMKDDKQFLFMVKELMKIETQLLSAKIRAKEPVGGGGQQTVFVVLKGLEDEKQFGGTDKTVDLTQISEALNPLAQPKTEPEKEKFEVTL